MKMVSIAALFGADAARFPALLDRGFPLADARQVKERATPVEHTSPQGVRTSDGAWYRGQPFQCSPRDKETWRAVVLDNQEWCQASDRDGRGLSNVQRHKITSMQGHIDTPALCSVLGIPHPNTAEHCVKRASIQPLLGALFYADAPVSAKLKTTKRTAKIILSDGRIFSLTVSG
jgi:hypothetical protein